MAKAKKTPVQIGPKITLADVEKMDAQALKTALKDVIKLKGANVSLMGHQNHNSHGDVATKNVKDLKAKITKGGVR